MGECSVAADFVASVQQRGGRHGDQAGGEVGDGHLVFDRSKGIMGGLFGFPVAESGKVLFDDLSAFEDLFIFFAVSGNF